MIRRGLAPFALIVVLAGTTSELLLGAQRVITLACQDRPVMSCGFCLR